jgi:hypothetical protein
MIPVLGMIPVLAWRLLTWRFLSVAPAGSVGDGALVMTCALVVGCPG